MTINQLNPAKYLYSDTICSLSSDTETSGSTLKLLLDLVKNIAAVFDVQLQAWVFAYLHKLKTQQSI